MPHVDPEESRRAVTSAAGTEHTHGDLLDGFAAAQDEGVRLLVTAGDGLEPALARCLGAWRSDGSVVLVHPEVLVLEKLFADNASPAAGRYPVPAGTCRVVLGGRARQVGVLDGGIPESRIPDSRAVVGGGVCVRVPFEDLVVMRDSGSSSSSLLKTRNR